jgi:teichuronic acid biosynthesis glycosyltransferase TuaC
MKVLVVSHLYPSPGYDRHLFVHEQVKALRDAGAGVRVVSPTAMAPRLSWLSPQMRRRGQTPPTAIRDGVLASYPRVPVLPRRLLFSRSGDLYYLGMRRELPALRQEGGQVVHAHQALPDGAAGQRLAHALGVPYVVTVHGADVNVALPGGGAVAVRVAKVLADAAAVVAVSGAVARRLTGYVAPERLHVINNGLVGAGEPAPPAEFVGSAPLMLSVGHLIASKGHVAVLEAMAAVTDELPGLEYAIVGEGVCEAALREQARGLGLAARVHFLGRLAHSDVQRLMARTDLLVLPSSPEGFGLVYTEALAQGTPVVACRGEGPEDYVRDGENGFLVPPRDAAAVAEALRRAFADPQRLRQMGEAGRASVAGLTWQRNAERHMQLYEQITQTGRGLQTGGAAR